MRLLGFQLLGFYCKWGPGSPHPHPSDAKRLRHPSHGLRLYNLYLQLPNTEEEEEVSIY